MLLTIKELLVHKQQPKPSVPEQHELPQRQPINDVISLTGPALKETHLAVIHQPEILDIEYQTEEGKGLLARAE